MCSSDLLSLFFYGVSLASTRFDPGEVSFLSTGILLGQGIRSGHVSPLPFALLDFPCLLLSHFIQATSDDLPMLFVDIGVFSYRLLLAKTWDCPNCLYQFLMVLEKIFNMVRGHLISSYS